LQRLVLCLLLRLLLKLLPFATAIAASGSGFATAADPAVPYHGIHSHVFISNCQGGGRASSVVHVFICSADPVLHHTTAARMAVTWSLTPFFIYYTGTCCKGLLRLVLISQQQPAGSAPTLA
jgi:hypothetical protein